MRGYGLPRYPDIESPDKVDISYYGLAPSKHGEKRKSKRKKRMRRHWKRIERMRIKLKLNVRSLKWI